MMFSFDKRLTSCLRMSIKRASADSNPDDDSIGEALLIVINHLDDLAASTGKTLEASSACSEEYFWHAPISGIA